MYKCPHCGGEINPGAILASVSTPAKRRANKLNARFAGRPKGSKNKRKREDANQTAHRVVATAEKLTRQAVPRSVPEG